MSDISSDISEGEQMKLNRVLKNEWYKNLPALSISISLAAILLAPAVFATEPTAPTNAQPADEVKHIHVPFVHIDIKKHADGTKDYDVRAPFTKVHNPAGADNARVKAPFYKVDRQPTKAVSTNKTQTTQ